MRFKNSAQKKAVAAELANRSNFRGNIKMFDHVNNKHVSCHRNDCTIETAKNGKKIIVAKSPHGKHRVYRITY